MCALECPAPSALQPDLTQVLDCSREAVFALTFDARLAFCNRAAERLFDIGRNRSLGKRIPQKLFDAFKEILLRGPMAPHKHGGWRQMDLTPALHNREIQLETRYCLWRDERNQPRGYLVFSRDVTWERRLEAKMRKLAVKLVTLQDDERRQIARELHDSLGQLLTAAKIDAELVGRSATVGGAERQCLSEAIEILDRSLLEVRTLSFLLHPPTLQNTGFASAVGTYVEGFSKRSGIRVDLNLPNQLRPLPKDVEFVLFRVLQESLTNIHRHSGSKTARIALECTPRRLTFRISDSGRGIPSEKLHEVAKTGRGEGIGLMGMRERLEEFGGQLRLHSDRKGVMLTVSVPLRRGAAAA